jgi:GNAT superfamily N-acetyltransferase
MSTVVRPLEFSGDSAAVAAIWSAACGVGLSMPSHVARYHLRPVRCGRMMGQMALVDGQPAGFVLASAFADDARIAPATMGWVNAIAVAPDHQRRGLGNALLAWAEARLREQGVTDVQLGGSVRSVVPALPVELANEPFFAKRGFTRAGAQPYVWDVGRDLRGYASPECVQPTDGEALPGQPGQEGDLLRFLEREFPGHWRVDLEDFLHLGGRIGDYVLLWTSRGVDGFCKLTFGDSVQPLERYYPYGLPQPWGQLGPIGVSADCRGKGYGAAIMDAGLRRLGEAGVIGCLIDWTSIVDFYARFGFAPHRQYVRMSKRLSRA